MLRWIYNRNKRKFWDLVVEDFYGEIPSRVREPSIDFLKRGRGTLEPFWSIQAYNIQRRSIADSKNALVYEGFLLCIRTMLAIVTKGDIPKLADAGIKEEKTKPEEGILSFMQLAKKRNGEI